MSNKKITYLSTFIHTTLKSEAEELAKQIDADEMILKSFQNSLEEKKKREKYLLKSIEIIDGGDLSKLAAAALVTCIKKFGGANGNKKSEKV